MNFDQASHNNKVALLTLAQMGEADRAAEAGVDGFGLMEAAGSAVAAISSVFRYPTTAKIRVGLRGSR